MSVLLAQPTPHSLIERIRRGTDGADWKRFVQLYAPMMMVWGRKLNVRGEELNDLLQDVFVLLIQKLPEFEYDPKRRFRGWLWTVLSNRARERFRQVRPDEAGVPLPEGTLVQADALPDWIEADFQRELCGRALEVMRSEFAPEVWQACWQTVVMGREPQEVATEMGCALDTVYRWRKRVLRRLRRELDGMID